MGRTARFFGATLVASIGLLMATGCPADEPEDGTSTAASSVGNGSATTNVSSSGSGSTGADASSGSDASDTDTDTDTDSGGPAVVYETDVQPIWNAGCTCHLMGDSGTMTAPFLTLNPGMSYAQLVGVVSEQAASLSRVAEGAPEESYLWLKLNDTHAEVGDGTVMPQTGMLAAEQLDLIELWITQGAEP